MTQRVTSNESWEKEISDLKYKLEQMDEDNKTLQIKVSEQELHIMDQYDIQQDQVSEIVELNLHTEAQTSKIMELEQEIKQLLENKDFFEKAKKDLDDSINPKMFKSP